MERVLGRYVAAPALVLLATATFYGVGGGNTALALLIVTMIAVLPAYWSALARDPVFWLTVVYLIWVPLSAAAITKAHPEAATMIWDYAGDWARTLFLPVLVTAFWLARFPRLIRWLPLMLGIGYSLRVLERTTPQMLADFIAGADRATYGNSATHFGMYSLIVLIATAASITPIRQLDRTWIRVIGYTLLAAIGFIALAGLVFSQTRTAWLATAIVGTTLVAAYLRRRSIDRPYWICVVGALLLTALLLMSLGALFHDIIMPRIMQVSGTVWQVLSGHWDQLPYDSVGYRMRAYAVGINTWLENPVFGHGPGIDLLTMSNQDHGDGQQTVHFHNAYINVLATFGLIGFSMFAALVFIVGRRAVRIYRAGGMCWSTAMFVLGASATLLFCSLFYQLLTSYRMPFLLGVVGALACTANRRATSASQHLSGKPVA